MVADFTYYAPTKVVFGKDAELQVGSLIQAEGCNKVLVHYGSESARKSGLLQSVFDSLTNAGIAYVELGGVVPNPRLSKVYEGIELCKKEHVDFLLAVGGGSVIDSAKAIGYGLYHEGDVWDFFEQKRDVEGCYPVGCVLTIAAAGSEMSSSSVITNENGNLKRGLNHDSSRCKFAVMNPMLTYTLPYYQTMSGAVDIMMHTLERYLIISDTMKLTDEIAQALLKTVMKAALVLKDNPFDYDARANLMWASSLSHNGLTGLGNSTRGDWAPHQLEHEMGGMFDVAHGAGLAAIWESWALFVYKQKPQRFAQLGYSILDIKNSGDALADARSTIESLVSFFSSIDMPTNFAELGIHPTEAEIDEMTEKATFYGKRTLGDFLVLDAEKIKKIYVMANKVKE